MMGIVKFSYVKKADTGKICRVLPANSVRVADEENQFPSDKIF